MVIVCVRVCIVRAIAPCDTMPSGSRLQFQFHSQKRITIHAIPILMPTLIPTLMPQLIPPGQYSTSLSWNELSLCSVTMELRPLVTLVWKFLWVPAKDWNAFCIAITSKKLYWKFVKFLCRRFCLYQHLIFNNNFMKKLILINGLLLIL